MWIPHPPEDVCESHLNQKMFVNPTSSRRCLLIPPPPEDVCESHLNQKMFVNPTSNRRCLWIPPPPEDVCESHLNRWTKSTSTYPPKPSPLSVFFNTICCFWLTQRGGGEGKGGDFCGQSFLQMLWAILLKQCCLCLNIWLLF